MLPSNASSEIARCTVQSDLAGRIMMMESAGGGNLPSQVYAVYLFENIQIIDSVDGQS